jgi:hypothetical protein
MVDWAYGLNQYPDREKKVPKKDFREDKTVGQDMVENWDKLGFVVKTTDSKGRETYIETERDPDHVLAPRPALKLGPPTASETRSKA